MPRGGDRDARDSGQWGTALRWLGDDTEYGLYFMNYHGRTPTVGTVTAGASALASIPGIVATANRIAPGSGSGLAQSVMLGRGQYLPRLPGRHSPVRREFLYHLVHRYRMDRRDRVIGPTRRCRSTPTT